MRSVLLLVLMTWSAICLAQPGSTSLKKLGNAGSESWAVVIGISDYQDEAIPNLRFAHKDAEAFANFLRSPAGGALDDDHLKLLTNQNATAGRIAEALDGLLEQAGEGDQVIIYFSGHGDVERKTVSQPGFLLAWDAPSRVYMGGGTYSLSFLQEVVTTLSTQNLAKVVVITDACHAGKLSGSQIGGAQLTSANLARQHANEVKILSCQPNEFSQEGTQWGGGRGAFSYHLVDGLFGLADRNSDGIVTVGEIDRYLEDNVTAEVAPQSQVPMLLGNKTERLATVNEAILAEIKKGKSTGMLVFAATESRGLEDDILAKLDSGIIKRYFAFKKAVAEKRLLPDAKSLNPQPSADELYASLSAEPGLAPLYGFMKRNYAAALQDDAQQAVNAYLAANPTELQRRFENEEDYGLYPRYLEKATELLGEKHFYYKNLMAKRLYFEGLQLRLEEDNKTSGDSIAYQQAIDKQLKALGFEENAPFVLNELGVLHTRLKLSEKAVDYYEKAIKQTPNWGLPYVNLCLEYFYNNDFEKAIEPGDKALECMPDYPQLYNLLGWVNSDPSSYLDKRNWKRKGVELKEDFFYTHDNISTFSEKKSKFEKTVHLLKKAISLDSAYASAHSNLGKIYHQIGLLDEAAYHLKKSIQIDSTNHFSFLYLGEVLNQQSKFEEAEAAVKNAIVLAKENDTSYVPFWYNDLGLIYQQWEKPDKALEAYQMAIELDPNYSFPYGNSASIYFNKGDYQKTEWYCLKERDVTPKNPSAYQQFGWFYKFIKRYQDAEFMYLKAIEIHPEYTVAITELVELYLETKQFGKGITIFKRRLEKEPDNLSYLAPMEIFYFHLGDLGKTEEYSERVSEKFKEDISQAGDLAFQYYAGKHFEKAVYYFKKNIETAPINFNNEYYISCGYALLGKREEAIDWLSKAIGKSFKDFNHIHTDPELESIRNEPAFKALMEKHFPGQVYEGKPADIENTEPIYFRENCLLLADFYESEGEHDRAKWLREKATKLKAAEIK